MSTLTTGFLIADIVCLVVSNLIMWKDRKNFRESKLLSICFLCLKLSIALPIAYVCIILFTFCYDYVQMINSPMTYMVFYYYIAFALLLGGIMIVYEHQEKALLILSTIIVVYQGYIARVIHSKHYIFKLAGDLSINIYRYGEAIGNLIAYSGLILTVLAIISVLRYRKIRFN